MTTRFSLGARIASFGHAIRGLTELLATQHNARIHAAATLAACALAGLLGISAGEWLALVLAIAAVWSAEAMNTAFEALCDLVSPDRRALVQRVKDVAAGAVLVSAAGAATVGLIVFGPRLVNLVR
ncbi:MAG: diacylglycerol kinase family protein [Myxococcales bacterium]|nr:MAG: diacylglycerol kinase family protein [Myxococcales bacterium]